MAPSPAHGGTRAVGCASMRSRPFQGPRGESSMKKQRPSLRFTRIRRRSGLPDADLEAAGGRPYFHVAGANLDPTVLTGGDRRSLEYELSENPIRGVLAHPHKTAGGAAPQPLPRRFEPRCHELSHAIRDSGRRRGQYPHDRLAGRGGLASGPPGSRLLERKLKQLRTFLLLEECAGDAAGVARPAQAVDAIGVTIDIDERAGGQRLAAERRDWTAARDLGRQVYASAGLSLQRFQPQVEHAHAEHPTNMRLVRCGADQERLGCVSGLRSAAWWFHAGRPDGIGPVISAGW